MIMLSLEFNHLSIKVLADFGKNPLHFAQDLASKYSAAM
jgi:hypothetical protein